MAKESLKERLKRERLEKEAEVKKQCESFAKEKHTEAQLKKWSNQHKGLWFLPIFDQDDETKIIALGIFKPITREALSYATTKMEEGGLYEFLEAAMRECWVAGEEAILDDDKYFLPASSKFNKMIEGHNAMLLKR
jgi:hypothetical protein